MYRTSERTSLSRKMAELEDRWRKSQEDRYMLELKFKEVLKGLANNNEGAKLLRIREKYHRFLENEDRRNQRNDQILRTLDKIDSQANILAAKTERLRLLKLHYEAYMKRMYPTWKISEDEEEYLSSKNKEVFYPSSHKQRREAMSSNSHKRGGNVSRKLMYHNSPYVNKSPYSSNNVLDDRKLGSVLLSNGGSLDNPSRQSRGENSGQLDLNHEFSNINLNSTRKNGNSRALSAEQEENTSKDLLNLSLSDDNPINDGTMPAEVRAADEKSCNRSISSSPSYARVKEDVNREPSCANVNPETLMDKRDCNSLASDMGSALNKELTKVGEDNDSEFDNKSDIEKLNSVSSKKKVSKSPIVKEDVEEGKPCVVITQPTPDIGLSSSGEDFERKGSKPLQISKINEEQKSLSYHEVSEAEVSEGERVGSVTSVRKEEIGYSPDEEQSPRHFLGGNVEGPYQFSSSDADYDELENQMAAVVERRGNDESIPKVSDDIECESKPNVKGQDAEQQKSYDSSKKGKSDLVPEERKYDVHEDDVMDEGRLDKNVEITKIQENYEVSADGHREDYIKQEEAENADLMKRNDRKVKSYDSERDYEAGSSSMDVNSEILDEDVNADGNTYHVDESIKEVNESGNSDGVVEENSPAHLVGQTAQEEAESQLENEETNDYYPKEHNDGVVEENSPAHVVGLTAQEEAESQLEIEETKESNPSVEQKEFPELEDVAEQNYADFEQVREDQHISHESLEYTEERDEEKADVRTQSDDEQNDDSPEYFDGREEEQNERFIEENPNEDLGSKAVGDLESKNLEGADEEDGYNTVNVQQGLQEQEEWDADEFKDEPVNREENVGSHYEDREVDRGDEYERELRKQEEDNGEYGRQEQEIEGRRHYETEEQENYQKQEIDENEFDNQNVSHHEGESNRQYAEDENVYERQDYEATENEGDVIQRKDDQIIVEEVEGNIIPEQEEYERYETEEQFIEKPERLNEIEEPEEPSHYTPKDGQQEERYVGNDEEHGQYEREVEEQEYDRYRDYVRHETVSEESNRYHHEEENKEEREIQPDVEEQEIQPDVEEQEIQPDVEEREIQPDVEERDQSSNVEDQRTMEEVTAESIGPVGGEYSNQEKEHEVNEKSEGRYKELVEEDQVYGKNVQESQEFVNEDHGIEKEETQTLSPENMEHRQEVFTPESNISENAEIENQIHEHILTEEIRNEKEEAIPHVEEVKTIPEEVKTVPEEVKTIPEEVKTIPEEVKTIPEEVKEETNVVVKEVKKENVVRKEKKENEAVASSLSVEKHERTAKESSPAGSRQSARQLGKKEYDPHKVEKLKSTIRKFQLKKDNKLDKTGRKGVDSKK